MSKIILILTLLSNISFAQDKFDLFSLKSDTTKDCSKMLGVGSAKPGDTFEIKDPYDDMLVYFASSSEMFDGTLLMPTKVEDKYFFTMPIGESMGKKKEKYLVAFTNGEKYCLTKVTLRPMETGLSFDTDEYLAELKRFIDLNAKIYGSDYETLKNTIPEDPRFFRLAAVVRAIEGLEKSEPTPEVAHYLNTIGLIDSLKKINQDMESKVPVINSGNRDEFKLKQLNTTNFLFRNSECSYYENPYEIKDEDHLSLLMSKLPTLKNTEDVLKIANNLAGLLGVLEVLPFSGAITIGITAMSVANKFQQAFVPNTFTELDFKYDKKLREDTLVNGYVHQVTVEAKGPEFDITRNSLDLVNALVGAIPGWGAAWGALTYFNQDALGQEMDRMSAQFCVKIKEKEWGPIEITQQRYYKLRTSNTIAKPVVKIENDSNGGKSSYKAINIGSGSLIVEIVEEEFGGKTIKKYQPVEVEEVYLEFKPTAISAAKPGTTETFKITLDAENPTKGDISFTLTAGEIKNQKRLSEDTWEITVKSSDKLKDFPIRITGKFEGKTLPDNASRTAIAEIHVRDPSIEIIPPSTETCIVKGKNFPLKAVVDGANPPHTITWQTSTGQIANTSELGATWRPTREGSHTIKASLKLEDGREVSDTIILNTEEKCGNIIVKFKYYRYQYRLTENKIDTPGRNSDIWRISEKYESTDKQQYQFRFDESEFNDQNFVEIETSKFGFEKELYRQFYDDIFPPLNCRTLSNPVIRVTKLPEFFEEDGYITLSIGIAKNSPASYVCDGENGEGPRKATFPGAFGCQIPRSKSVKFPGNFYKTKKGTKEVFEYKKEPNPTDTVTSGTRIATKERTNCTLEITIANDKK